MNTTQQVEKKEQEARGVKPLVWAHRGASGYAPENTMEAFQLAHEQGADGIELDVQLTRDGEVVVIHDERIDRTSTGTGYVRDYSLKELRAFSFHKTQPAYWNGTDSIRLPLLSEVLDFIRDTGMQLNIELKNGIFDYPKLEEKVLWLVEEKDVREQVIYSSFNHYSIRRLGKLDTDAVRGILYSDRFLNVPEYAFQMGVDAVHPALWHLDEAGYIARCHELGLKVHVWTVNDRTAMRQLAERGADAIITNYPDVCREETADFAS